MIRNAVPGDAHGIAGVFVAAWRDGYRGVVPDVVIDGLDVTEWTARFVILLLDRSLRTAVWEDSGTGGGVLGFSRFGRDVTQAVTPNGDGPPAGYLASLYVDPEAAGRGIGSALLVHTLDAMSAGSSEVSLWVFTANHRARRLYERWGFRPTDETSTDPRWQAEQTRYRRPAG